MTSQEIRALQAPLKSQYKEHPESAVIALHAQGTAGAEVTFDVHTKHGIVVAGLHPATGGSGKEICSGDLLLESLVACAGVTLKAVAAALDIQLRNAKVIADGDIDFRGTLGVAKDAPVGFKNIRLHFSLDTDADEEKISALIRLTERYCVVFQTLSHPPAFKISYDNGAGS